MRIDDVAVEDVPLHIMLVLDNSSSVHGAPLAHLKDAASAVGGLVHGDDRAALLTFSGAIRLLSGWSGDRSRLEAALGRTEAMGATALHDATYVGLTLRAPQPGRTLVLVFSDGDDTASWLSAQHVLDAARRSEAVVYAVTMRAGGLPSGGYRLDFRSGLQQPVKKAPTPVLMQPFLQTLADETGGKVVDAHRSERLRETFVQIVGEFRKRYLLTYTPRGVEKGGWHQLEVKVKGRRVKVAARRGYFR